MFTAEISNRTEALKAAALFAAAAAFAAFACVRLVGLALQDMQLGDQRATLMMTAELLVITELEQHALNFDTALTPAQLDKASDDQLHMMMGASMDLFVALDQPERSSFAVEADLRLAAASLDDLAENGLALANELNAALMYEELQGRIEAINTERNSRGTGANII